MNRLGRALFSIVAVSIVSSGEASAMSGRGTVCFNEMNSREADACLERALVDAQTTLKKKYAAVDAMLSGQPSHAFLVKSQRLWESYVRQSCDGMVNSAEGSETPAMMQDADVLSCKVELTIERAKDLDRMFYVPLHD